MTALAFDPAREEAELRAYLGDAWDRGRLERWQDELEAELARVGDEATLYRTSQAYLYNLTAFAMTGTKRPYLETLVRAVPRGARLLDYGCGIGSDGLLLLEAGYRVTFADFDSPSTRYLRWRLERRGLEAPVHDLDRPGSLGDHDLAYAFDVLEHVEDPFALLAELERHGALVLVNLLREAPGDTRLHRALPIPELLAHAAGRRLLRYRRLHHGRSHLVLYGREHAHGVERARARAALLAGRVRARLSGCFTPALSLPRLAQPDLVYQGAFRLPAQVSDKKTFAYGGTALAYNPAHRSLFAVGHDWYQLTAEVTIPRPVRSSSLRDLHRARFRQGFADATNGKIDETGETGNKIGGQLVYRGRLYGSVYVYYDAAGSQVVSHWARPSTRLTGAGAKGLYRVGKLGAGMVSGFMAEIPSEWRSLLGGPALTGNCCIPIISRTSFGPGAFAFDPAKLGAADPVAATPLVYYPQHRHARRLGLDVEPREGPVRRRDDDSRRRLPGARAACCSSARREPARSVTARAPTSGASRARRRPTGRPGATTRTARARGRTRTRTCPRSGPTTRPTCSRCAGAASGRGR